MGLKSRVVPYVSVMLGCVYAAAAFDWPAAGGTAVIPAGETVEVTSTSDLNAAAACGAIEIGDGATLSFTNVTANATIAGAIRGTGTLLGCNAATGKNNNSTGTYRLTFTGDLSGFTGNLAFRYLYATFNTAKCGTFPMKFVEENNNTVQLQGAYTYANPIDFSGGANQGLLIGALATCAGDIVWRGGSIRGTSGNPPTSGGTITGTITCPNNDIYIENGIKMLGPVFTGASGKYLRVDGGPLDLQAKISGFSQLHTYRPTGVITFLADDLVPATCAIQFGISSWAGGGYLDLNGHDQQCASITHSSNEQNFCTPANTTITSGTAPATFSIVGAQGNVTFPGSLKGHVSLRYASSSANTLTMTSGVHTTDGALRVQKGKMRLTAGSGLPNLSELEVSGTGELTLESSDVNPGHVVVTLADDGVLTLAEGVTLVADQARVNGKGLKPGSYTKDSAEMAGRLAGAGTLTVVNDAPVVEGATFTWTGAGADALVTTAANWAGGAAPAFDGTERLVFPTDAARTTATFAATVEVYAIDVRGEAPFTLDAANASAKIVMGAGGFNLTNTHVSAIVQHRLNVPVELGPLPQTWTLASTNVRLEVNAPWTGRPAGDAPLTIRSWGRLLLKADNAALETGLVVTNCATSFGNAFGPLGQPFVYHEKGLGAATRPATFLGGLPRFMNASRPFTNAVPLRVSNVATGVEQAYFNDSSAHPLYLDGRVTYIAWADGETYVRSGVHFRGGIAVENGKNLSLRINGAHTYIENEPVAFDGNLYIDYGNTLHIGSQGNSWRQLCLYKATLVCEADDVLPAGSSVRMSEPNSWYSGWPVVDLNGHDQRCARFYSGLDLKAFPDRYVALRSAEPALLEVKGETVYNDVAALTVLGQAGLCFDAPGSLAFTNRLSSTTGTLQVKRGAVKICAGAGWTATTNIVLNGGAIAVAKGAGAKAFGADQNLSEAAVTRTAGVFDVAAGEQATVRTMVFVDESGKVRGVTPGVYYAKDSAAAVPASYKVDWITGGGALRILRSAIPNGTMLLIR